MSSRRKPQLAVPPTTEMVPSDGKTPTPATMETAPDPVINKRLRLDMDRLSIVDYDEITERFALGNEWNPKDVRSYVFKTLGLTEEAANDSVQITLTEYLQAYQRFWQLLNWVASGKKLESA